MGKWGKANVNALQPEVDAKNEDGPRWTITGEHVDIYVDTFILAVMFCQSGY